jgi:hypothetical protein
MPDPKANIALAPARLVAALPFACVALLAIVAGGLVAAISAHAPSRPLVWMVAYLVLVAGITQAALGTGQAGLSGRAPSMRQVAMQCLVFNLGNAGVIAGTLGGSARLTDAGTVAFVIALLMFLRGTRGACAGWLIFVHRGVLALVAAGAVVGMLLSALRALH